MSGYVNVGGGIGAAMLANGVLNAVSGPLFAQIERERREGPAYVEALRGARTMRYVGFTRKDSRSYDSRAESWEREHGIPASWHRLG